jgi:uncharacterized repeat protein (TIGR02543 family)
MEKRQVRRLAIASVVVTGLMVLLLVACQQPTTLPDTYMVLYDGNGNTSGDAPIDAIGYEPGKTVIVLGNGGNLEKAGYEFGAWNTASDGSGVTYAPGQTFVMGLADVTLYAQWTSVYTVTYNGNGAGSGSVPVDDTPYAAGSIVTVLGNTGDLEKAGYSFAGWNTAAGGGGITYSPGQRFVLSAAHVTLYALWTENPTSAVTYDGNGPDSGDAPVDKTNYEPGQLVTVLGNTGNLVRAGFSFAGWNLASDGSSASYVAGQTFLMGQTDVTLYAQWVPTYNVTYDGNGADSGSVPVDETRYPPGSVVTVLGNTGSLNRDGYAFAGWNSASDGSGASYAAGQTFVIGSADVTLYARWVLVYTVTYDGNGADSGNPPVDATEYVAGSLVAVLGPGSLDRSAKLFGAWNTAADGLAEQYAPGDIIAMGSGDITLYAQWVPDPAKIEATDGADDDLFGLSVSISGDYAIVGAPFDDDNGSASGSAYVFRRTGIDSWDSGTKLTASDGMAHDHFGYAVSISGEYAIVGSPCDYDAEEGCGSAYVFRRTGINSWDSGTKLVAPDADINNSFGHSVSVAGEYAVIGTPGDDDNGGDSGAAYVFHRTGTSSWGPGTKLIALDGTLGDEFGRSVSIHGSYAIIGAPHDDDYGLSSGSAYVFRRTATNTWDSGTKLTAFDAAGHDFFGESVSIFSDYVIIGASGDDDNGGDSGAAYVFHRTGTNAWDSGTKLIALDGARDDGFGRSVSVHGDYAIIGMPHDDDNGDGSGAAYMFHRSAGDTWDSGTKLIASEAAAQGFFGASVSIFGDYAIVGAPGDSQPGAAYTMVVAP